MRFVFGCPTCKARIEADSSLSGQQSACPQCGKLVAVPDSRVDTGTTLAGFRLERRLGKGAWARSGWPRSSR
jgi:DNA-directed RNA polymerase subunit RPC12/RpoP